MVSQAGISGLENNEEEADVWPMVPPIADRSLAPRFRTVQTLE